MSKNLKEFLDRLSALSREFGVVISGCGCCGSPGLSEEKVSETGHYSCDAYGDYLKFSKTETIE